MVDIENCDCSHDLPINAPLADIQIVHEVAICYIFIGFSIEFGLFELTDDGEVVGDASVADVKS